MSICATALDHPFVFFRYMCLTGQIVDSRDYYRQGARIS